MNGLLEILAGVADVFAILASALALWIFLAKRRQLSTALQLLLNYSFQTTLGELKEKVERLNDYNANEPSHLPEIRGLLHEIAGQIRGNRKLARTMGALLSKTEALADGKKLPEPRKRSITGELRESIRNARVNSLQQGTEPFDE